MTVSIELDDLAVKCLEHYVPDAESWVKEAVQAKIAACKKRLLRDCIERALEKSLPVPSTTDDILTQLFTSKDYKCRKVRDLGDNRGNNGESTKASL